MFLYKYNGGFLVIYGLFFVSATFFFGSFNPTIHFLVLETGSRWNLNSHVWKAWIVLYNLISSFSVYLFLFV